MDNIVKYDFTSDRLGFRNWVDSDIDKMLELNQDPDVMEHFPSIQDRMATAGFINRMQEQYSTYGYCYYATELIANQEFIGFIGLANQDYGDELGKFVDIGWRLKKSAWGNGYATEGAKRCLVFAKEVAKLSEIYAVASLGNQKSFAVMHKIGMKSVKEFIHPKLLDYPAIQKCLLYQINL